jgi:hypothetical protein
MTPKYTIMYYKNTVNDNPEHTAKGFLYSTA